MAKEKRLIELDCLIDNIDWDNDLQKWTLRGEPEDIPTVDAAEVVRCKDCKHWSMGFCNHFGYYSYEPMTNEEDFCSNGERKAHG